MRLNKSIPIWRDANALLIAVENTVRHFPRYHKYTLGSEMRLKAMQICRLIAYAWQNKSRTPTVLPRLVDAVDDLKIQIQLAKELQALQNFAHFQQLTELAVSVGKQSGGWYRRVAKPELADSSAKRADSLCPNAANVRASAGAKRKASDR